MSAPETIPDLPTVITKLRAAGCVFAEDEARLLRTTARTATELTTMLEQRVAGRPLEHILGWVDFYGMRLTVAPHVFVPRRRTELLARTAIAHTPPDSVVVELCCGSGAVAAAIAATNHRIDLHAVDIDPTAVQCARINLAATKAHIYQGDLYTPLPPALRGQVDLLVVNAPYVPTDELQRLPPEARLHEPRTALDGGQQGTDVLQRTIAQATQWLTPNGHLLMETSAHQAPRIVALAAEHGLHAFTTRSEDLNATVVTATGMTPPPTPSLPY